MTMKNSSDTIGNQTRDFSACSAVLKPTAPPRDTSKDNKKWKFFLYTWKHMESGVILSRSTRYKSSFSQPGRLFSGKSSAGPTELKVLWAWEPVRKFYSRDKHVTLVTNWILEANGTKKFCKEYFLSHTVKLMKRNALSFENITYANLNILLTVHLNIFIF